MAAKPTEKTTRRIAVILGSGGSGRNLMDLVLPLLVRDREVEMQGVFVEEAEVQHAAELPFVQELCRVTFSVREFNSDQFERALTLRMRTAQRALEVLARRTGVLHSFRNVRGPAVRLLRETVSTSDITVFEPALRLAGTMASGAGRKHRRPPIVVAISDLDSGRSALRAAGHLAEGDLSRVRVLATGSAAQDRAGVLRLCEEVLAGRPARLRLLVSAEPVGALVETTQSEGAALLVISATDDLLEPATLQSLRERLRCPICLVRQWQGPPIQSET
jgi:hypothetical protein